MSEWDSGSLGFRAQGAFWICKDFVRGGDEHLQALECLGLRRCFLFF